MTQSSLHACSGPHPGYTCCANLKLLDSAKAIWLSENHHDPAKQPRPVVTTNELIGPELYIPEMPICLLGGTYNIADPLAPTECSLHGTAINLNMHAQLPVPALRCATRWGVVLLSGTGLLLLGFGLGHGRWPGVPDQIRESLVKIGPLAMGAITCLAAISQLPFEDRSALGLSYWFTLFLCVQAVLQESRTARIVGWMVGFLFLGVAVHDMAFLKAGDFDIATRLMLSH